MAPEVARADAQRLCLSWKHLTLEFRRAGNIMYSYQQQKQQQHNNNNSNNNVKDVWSETIVRTTK